MDFPRGEDARPSPPRPTRLRLAFETAFRRLTLLAFVLLEVRTWLWLAGVFPWIPRRRRFRILLLWTPKLGFLALLFGASVCVLADLILRLLVHPLVRTWYTPRADIEWATATHLRAGEAPLAAVPARHRQGRSWRAGTLVLTDRRIWFFPRAWDQEPWAADRKEVRGLEIHPQRRWAWGMVVGLPGPVRLLTDAGPELFAVWRPEQLATWLARGSTLPAASSPERTA